MLEKLLDYAACHPIKFDFVLCPCNWQCDTSCSIISDKCKLRITLFHGTILVLRSVFFMKKDESHFYFLLFDGLILFQEEDTFCHFV